MKTQTVLIIILTILLVGVFASAGLFMWEKNQLAQALDNVVAERESFRAESIDLQNRYDEVTRLAYTKPFESHSALQEWFKSHVFYDPDTAYSEDAMKMMNEARNDGYWLGITCVESKYENGELSLIVPVYPAIDYSNIYFYNIAIVGNDIYIVDPARGTDVKMAEMKATFNWDATPTTYHKVQ